MSFSTRQAFARQRRQALGITPDIERITGMPVQLPWNEDPFPCPVQPLHAEAPPLRPIQAAALGLLAAQEPPRGLVGAIGVGAGKTLIDLLAPTVVPCQRPVIMVPPDLQAQLHRDRQEWSRHYRFHPNTQVIPYSALSATSGADLLEEARPDLVVLDEAHMVRHRSSARTRRVLRYARQHPQTRWVVLSGTLTGKALYEMAHLLELALRGGSPCPLHDPVLRAWDAVVGVDGEPSYEDKLKLRGLLTWAGEENPRKAFQKRLRSTPGVITTEEGAVGTPLVVRTVTVPPSKALREAINTLTWKWRTPDGRDLSEASERAAMLSTLALGFYYVPTWAPGVEEDTQREYREARSGWASWVSHYLSHGARRGMDSQALLERAADAGRLQRAATEAWERWKPLKLSVPAPWPVEVWIDDEPLRRTLLRTLNTYQRALVFYQSAAVERRLQALGFDVRGAGSSAPPEEEPYPALSLRVHGKGKNLQAWDTMVVLEPPSSGMRWEQLIGRIHRPPGLDAQGRLRPEADLCTVEVINPGARLEKAKEDAQYIAHTTGQKQKLLYCAWSDLKMDHTRAL